MGQRRSRGVTLTEVLVAIAILGMVFGLTKLGVDWMAALGRQRVLLNAQWNGQVVLYEMTRGVRNSKKIVQISSGTLVLSVFRPAATNGFSDADANFVVAHATATLTYDYVTTSSETYVRRTYVFPDPSYNPGNPNADMDPNCPLLTKTSKLLVNMLEPPMNDNWMFRPFGSLDPANYEAVEIMIRLRPSYWNITQYATPIEYRTISMKRTSGTQ